MVCWISEKLLEVPNDVNEWGWTKTKLAQGAGVTITRSWNSDEDHVCLGPEAFNISLTNIQPFYQISQESTLSSDSTAAILL